LLRSDDAEDYYEAADDVSGDAAEGDEGGEVTSKGGFFGFGWFFWVGLGHFYDMFCILLKNFIKVH